MSGSLAPAGLPRPDELATYYLALLYPGPSYDGWPPASPEQAAVVQAHASHVWHIQQPGGPAVAGGPVMAGPTGPGDPPPPLGLVVLQAASSADAEQIAAADPGVVAGRFRVVVYPWLVPEGRLTD